MKHGSDLFEKSFDVQFHDICIWRHLETFILALCDGKGQRRTLRCASKKTRSWTCPVRLFGDVHLGDWDCYVLFFVPMLDGLMGKEAKMVPEVPAWLGFMMRMDSASMMCIVTLWICSILLLDAELPSILDLDRPVEKSTQA